jgi:HEPN domain-containing protein
MEPRDKAKMDLVRQWLEKAEKDFNLARHLIEERHSYCEAIAFHSQQTVEKLLKGFLVYHQVEFPKTHNLGELLDLVATREPTLALALGDITALNPYGVEYRYPADFPDLTQEDADGAFRLAEKVWLAIKPRLTLSSWEGPQGH